MNRETLRETFRDGADTYARARPSYPPDVVDKVTGGRRDLVALEVGCGTGQATRLFAAATRELTAIDISADALAIADRELAGAPHVAFREATFETASLPERHYDLLFSAQAFHWVDPAVRFGRAAQVLKPGGQLALFWNFMRYDGNAIFASCRDCILRHVPSFEQWPDASDAQFHGYRSEWRTMVETSAAFEALEIDVFDWTETRSAPSYLEMLSTHSWMRHLEAPTREALHNDLETLLPASEPIALPFRTFLLRARNREEQ